MKKAFSCILAVLLLGALLTGCSGNTVPETSAADAPETETAATDTSAPVEETVPVTEDTEPAKAALPDGVYTAEFHTDSGMFHTNEACDGKGTLTVENGSMTLHVSLTSKSIVNLFLGLKEDAQKEGAELLQPTTDEVTYSDGTTEEVYGFDIPVPVLEEEFDLALIGKKGVWYDHRVFVSNPVLQEEN